MPPLIRSASIIGFLATVLVLSVGTAYAQSIYSYDHTRIYSQQSRYPSTLSYRNPVVRSTRTAQSSYYIPPRYVNPPMDYRYPTYSSSGVGYSCQYRNSNGECMIETYYNGNLRTNYTNYRTNSSTYYYSSDDDYYDYDDYYYDMDDDNYDYDDDDDSSDNDDDDYDYDDDEDDDFYEDDNAPDDDD